jgi:hypothetical protein
MVRGKSRSVASRQFHISRGNKGRRPGLPGHFILIQKVMISLLFAKGFNEVLGKIVEALDDVI